MENLNSHIANILLVDDRPENLLLLEATLADLGQNLVKANSGAEALRQVLKQNFCVILLDVQMPILDGYETAALIRERSRYTPIIFVTAVGNSDADAFRGYTAGAVDYVLKPIVPEILRAKVRVFIELFRLRAQSQEQAEQLEASNAELARKAAELQALNRELETFSHSVSHDLRAPLRSIQGFAQALEEDCAAQLDAQGRDYLRRVRAAAQRMSELIEDLLELARVTRTEMSRAPVDLSALCADVAAGLRAAQPEREVEFKIMPGLRAQGDVRLLRIVMENLLGNAWKYTSKQERTHIEFGAIVGPEQVAELSQVLNSEIGSTESGLEQTSSIYFVRDNGVGFDPALGHKLFITFQRLHSRDEFPGTGIGLATVARIVQRHGGRVGAQGTPGKGATFYFTLG